MYNKLDFDSHSEYLMYWHLQQQNKVTQSIDVENVWKIVLWNTKTVKFKSEFIISIYSLCYTILKLLEVVYNDGKCQTYKYLWLSNFKDK